MTRPLKLKQAVKGKLTMKIIKAAIPYSSCSLVQLGKLTGVSRNTIHRYLHKHPSVRKLLNEQIAQMVSQSEDVIFEAIIEKRDVSTAKWYLSCFDNRYKEKKELTLDGEIQINIKDASEVVAEEKKKKKKK